MADIDKIISLQDDELLNEIDEYKREAERALNRLDADIFDFIDSIEEGDITQDAEIEELIIASGLTAMITGLLNEGYENGIDLSADLYRSLYNKDFEFSDESISYLTSFKGIDANKFNQIQQNMKDEINKAVIGVQSGTFTKRSAINLLREHIKDTNVSIKTEIETRLSAFYRQAGNQLAIDAGFKKYRYVGPIIQTSREFCKKHVGEVRTADEWNALGPEQGQIQPVFVYGGGYNCQHRFVGVE